MAFVATDPNSAGPFQTFQIKDQMVRAYKLSASAFTTAGVNTQLGSLPPDTAIIGFDVYVKTALSGNGVTSPTATLGTAAAGTQFANAIAVTNTTGTNAKLSPVTAICQEQDPTNRTDIALWFRGSCSTGNPTAGEVWILVHFVR